jgi:RNA polymerase sigma factor (sigma-70 family)
VADSAKQARFEQAVMPYFDAAYNLARWLTRNPADADDVVQEAFLRAFQSFDNLRMPDAKPWLFAIVRNCCFTRLKKLRPFVELNESAPIASTDLDPEALQFQRVDAETLEAGMRKLPEEFREALVLREMEDLSYKEIADVTGVAIGTVMSRLSRARRQLQQHLAVPEKQESPR